MRGELSSMEDEVRKLIKQLNSNLELYEEPEYKITEKSEKGGEHLYIVHNLDAEMKEGEIYFGDMNDVIYNNQYALMGFLVDSIVNIEFKDKLVTIIFKSNSIKIEFVG